MATKMAGALLAAIVLLTSAFLIGGRYEIVGAEGPVVYRVDRWSGEIVGCSVAVCRVLPTKAAVR